jgi:hypothetical protein
MSRENPLWGAPRIQDELQLLGYELSSSTMATYMDRSAKRPSQTWRTFLKKHVEGIAAVDFFSVPTVLFQVLYVWVVLRHERRRGTIRRDCLDHFIVINEIHLRRIISRYPDYYHFTRCHGSRDRNSPVPPSIEPPEQGCIMAIPQVGGLHHRYGRAP